MSCSFIFFLFLPYLIGTTVEREIRSGTETTTTLATITLPPNVEVRNKKMNDKLIVYSKIISGGFWELLLFFTFFLIKDKTF